MTDSSPQGAPHSPALPVSAPPAAAAWRPIDARQRRVLGVLVEKAKTTPDAYPMSINALRSGTNQKNNRYPLMELENDDVEETLETLRGLGAVVEVQGDSRVPRYRHMLYDWLGVEKLELAVMAELLLRGAQTEGDLRARAARMDPIPDLNTLKTVVAALKGKRLIVGLTPEGRGHVVTHALYQPQEMEKLRAEYRAGAESDRSQHAPPAPPARDYAAPVAVAHAAPGPVARVAPAADRSVAPQAPAAAAADMSAELKGTVAMLRADVDQLRDELDRLRREVDDLLAQLR